MNRIISISFITILALSSCTNNNSNRTLGQPYEEFEGTVVEGLKKIYNAEGKLETEIPYKDSLPNGIQKEYYKTGQLFRETPLIKGKANGIVKEYSTKGKIYREMPVVNGRANGIIKKYYENSALFSEAPFENGLPVVGLKEYNEKGNLLETPKMIFKSKNMTRIDGTYILEILLSDKTIKPSYAQVLDFDNKEIVNRIPTVDGKGVLKLSVPAGAMMVKKLTFEAKYTTLRNNVCIIRDSFNLVIGN
jgi:hypothetical protein